MSKIFVIALLALVVGAGGYYIYSNRIQQPSPSPGKAETQETSALIETNNFKFIPNRLVVKPKAVVTVTNTDVASHTVTSDASGLFDTGLIGKGETKTFTAPDQGGEYPFHCAVHSSMTGVLVVE